MSAKDHQPNRVVLLEDRLAEMDQGSERDERWSGRQRLAHAVGSLVTMLLLLAWALYAAAPDLAYRLVHTIPAGH